MATPEPAREPTIGDVLHAISLLDALVRLTREEVASLRRVVSDEFTAVHRRIEALDRDVQALVRRVMEEGE